jgi:hypothetical protein
MRFLRIVFCSFIPISINELTYFLAS